MKFAKFFAINYSTRSGCPNTTQQCRCREVSRATFATQPWKGTKWRRGRERLDIKDRYPCAG